MALCACTDSAAKCLDACSFEGVMGHVLVWSGLSATQGVSQPLWTVYCIHTLALSLEWVVHLYSFKRGPFWYPLKAEPHHQGCCVRGCTRELGVSLKLGACWHCAW